MNEYKLKYVILKRIMLESHLNVWIYEALH